MPATSIHDNERNLERQLPATWERRACRLERRADVKADRTMVADILGKHIRGESSTGERANHDGGDSRRNIPNRTHTGHHNHETNHLQSRGKTLPSPGNHTERGRKPRGKATSQGSILKKEHPEALPAINVAMEDGNDHSQTKQLNPQASPETSKHGEGARYRRDRLQPPDRVVDRQLAPKGAGSQS